MIKSAIFTLNCLSLKKLFVNISQNFQRWLATIRVRYFWLIVIILTVLTYFFAHVFPIEKMKPTIVSRDITLNEILTRIFQLLAALATLIAAFVALFRDELRRIFTEKHSIIVDLYKENEKVVFENTNNEVINKKALAYYSTLKIYNGSNIYLKGCELYIENITCSNDSALQPNKILKGFKPTNWEYWKELKILIPIQGSAFHTIFILESPESNIVSPDQAKKQTDEGKQSSTPILRIDGNEIPFKEGVPNTIIIDYLLCVENSTAKKFSVTIKWVAKWENRLDDLGKLINVSITSNS